MTEVNVGIKHIRDEVETVPTAGAEMSVIGIVGTGPAADAAEFPLNTAVYLTTNEAAKVAKLGATGTLRDAVRGISGQLGVDQRAARMIVVRVAEEADVADTIANIIGVEADKSGIWQLLEAGTVLGVVPRLIIVPGFTSQFAYEGGSTEVNSAVKPGGNIGNGTVTPATPAYGAGVKAGIYEIRCIGGARSAVSAPKAGGNTGDGTLTGLSADAAAAIGAWRVICQQIVANSGVFAVVRPDGAFDGIVSAGEAYDSANGINFTINDGDADFVVGDEFVVTVANAVPADGGLFSVVDPDGIAKPNATVGVAYNDVVKFTLNDGGVDYAIGDGFNFTVAIIGGQALANAVVAALPTVLDRLRGVAIADGPATTRQAWIDWRETIASQRVIPLAVDVKVLDSEGNVVTKPSSPRIAGIAVRRDHETDGVPAFSWANQVVRDIVGPSRPIAFSLTDGAVEAQDLIGRNGGVVVRGESGVADAIAEGGFVFWGTDTCSEDPLWQFYHIVRLRDYIELGQIKAIRFYLGRFNITQQVVRAILNTMESHLSRLRARGYVLDFRVGFEPDKNTPEELRQGHLQTMFKAEEPPVLRKVVISSRRYREALDNLVRTLATQLNNLGA